MRLLLFVLLTFALTALPYPGEARQDEVGAKEERNQQGKGNVAPQPELQPPDAIAPNRPDNHGQTEDTPAKPNNKTHRARLEPQYPDGWYKASVAIGGAAFLVGMGTLFILWRQSVSIRLSALAAQKGAAAAFLNAQAVINAERAWVIPKISRMVKSIDDLSVRDKLGGFGQKQVTYFTLSIVNVGKTPAEIVGITVQALPHTGGTSGGLQDPPDYRNMPTHTRIRMLAPNEEQDVPEIDLNIWSPALTEDMRKYIGEMKLHNILRGVIHYRDVVRPEELHESRFCYTYFSKLDEYRPTGPPEHTKYT